MSVPGPNTQRMQASAKAWIQLRDRCYASFTDVAEFKELAQQVDAQCPIPGVAVADIFLRPGLDGPAYASKTRAIMYVQAMCGMGRMGVLEVGSAVLRYSSLHQIATPDGPIARYKNSWPYDASMLRYLAGISRAEGAIQFGDYAVRVVEMLAEWMRLFAVADASRDPSDNAVRAGLGSTREAFVELVAAVLEHANVLITLSKKRAAGRRDDGPDWSWADSLTLAAIREVLGEALSGFLPRTTTPAHLVERLRVFLGQTLPSLEHVDAELPKSPKTALEPLDASTWLQHVPIPDVPIPPSRAGLCIHLSAALVGPPMLDDEDLLIHLENRYRNDFQGAFVALILASFDVFANAIHRGEGQESALVLRSYLVNKLPLLLTRLAPSLFTTGNAPEICIRQALAQVDTNAFTFLPSVPGDTLRSNLFAETVREDFLLACCLHGLIPHSNIETILGENPHHALPSADRRMPEDLVAECFTEPERAISLVAELDLMDGNVGAVCAALTQVMVNMCTSRDTTGIKNLSHQLLSRPQRFDVLLLFGKPAVIFGPVCELLENGFKYDDDIGEYQPVYEEFGSVLLLVLAVVHRYGLTAGDLGFTRHEQTLICSLITAGHVGRPLKDLNDHEREHLELWMHDLFDAEAGGISEDLISSCSPPAFYRLVTAIFRQVILGVAYGNLTDDRLKSGIEYLAETFLRPSLVVAIWYLAEQLRVDIDVEQKAIVKIMHCMLLCNPSPGEPATLLQIVLGIGAAYMEPALVAYQRRRFRTSGVQTVVSNVVQALTSQGISSSRRIGYADAKEAAAWTSMPSGGLTFMMRQLFQTFVKWSANPGVNAMPTTYTHRQILLALRHLGVVRMIKCLLGEIRAHDDPATVGLAYDVAAEIVCAANVAKPGMFCGPGPRQSSTLRQALKWEALDAQTLADTDKETAEMIVRLHRHVEALLASAKHRQGPIFGDDVAALALGMDVDVPDNDFANAMATVGVGGDPSGFNLGMSADMGLGMPTTTAAQDVFNSLESLGWDGMQA